jgi:hypothetical protein
LPQITVTYPNGGEVFYAGYIYEITWTGSEVITDVLIEYSTNNGAAWTEITAFTPNDGSYEWTVPESPSETCLIRVSDANGDASDVSDAVFAIVVETYNCGYQGRAYETTPGGWIGIEGVEITFVSEDGTRTKRTITNGIGYYKISLKPQRYVVTAVHPDFHPYSSAPGFFVVTGNGYQTGNFFLTRK